MTIASYYLSPMGFRFQRRLRILKGLYLNVGAKKGPSLSVGGRGITTNISGRGVHETFSILGTGISYRTQNREVKAKEGKRGGCGGCLSLVVLFLIIGSCSSLFAPKNSINNSRTLATPSPGNCSGDKYADQARCKSDRSV
jgi:hypothetical protein